VRGRVQERGVGGTVEAGEETEGGYAEAWGG